MEKSLQNQLMLIILLIVTLFTSRVVPHSTEKREIQEIQGETLQSSLFGPILVTCLMTFDVFILFGGILLTKSTLKHQSENADFFDKSQSHQNEKMTTIVPMIPVANTRRKNYYMGGQNREYNNNDYKIEVNPDYIETYEYIEEYVERNEKFTLPNPNRNRLIQIQNESILRNNSTSTTNSTIKTKNPISQIKNSSSNMGSRSASPNFVQFPTVSRIKSSNMSSRSNSTSPSPSFVQFPPPARTKSSISSQKTNSSSSNMSLQSTSSSLILPSSTARIEHKPNYSYI